MIAAVTAFAISVTVFTALLLFVHAERRRSRRFFAPRLRGWLDHKVEQCGNRIGSGFDHFIRYIVQLHWYYSLHSLLRGILRVIVAFYTYFERLFERNRHRAKQLRKEKRELGAHHHLQQMAVHKADTALSPAEKRKRRHKELESKH